MMPAWYLRMNPRERVLAGIVATVLLALVNLAIWSALWGMSGQVRTQLAARKATRKEQRIFLKEHLMWVKRDKWLRERQPVLKSPDEVSTLLDQVKQAAAKNSVLIENPQIGPSDSTATRKSVSAVIETKSPWPPLVHLLYDVQKPEAFVAFENVNLMIDSGDPTLMRGRLKIAKWFVPTKK